MSDIYQKGGVGSEFYENKFLFCNCDIRGVVELCMTQFPSLNFSIFNLFLAHISFILCGKMKSSSEYFVNIYTFVNIFTLALSWWTSVVQAAYYVCGVYGFFVLVSKMMISLHLFQHQSLAKTLLPCPSTWDWLMLYLLPKTSFLK